MSELWLFYGMFDDLTDYLTSMRSISSVDSHRQTAFFHPQNLGPLKDPMGGVWHLTCIFNLAFKYRQIFASEVDFIDHDISFQDHRITGDIMFDFVDIPRDNVNVCDLNETTIPDCFYFELFLCHVFDFWEIVVLDQIVDCTDS